MPVDRSHEQLDQVTDVLESMFICGITQEVMQDPVCAADNHTYERAAIEAWLREHNTSPITRERLANNQLRPNHLVKSAIAEAHERGMLPRE